jgi:hypothetical protein
MNNRSCLLREAIVLSARIGTEGIFGWVDTIEHGMSATFLEAASALTSDSLVAQRRS